MDYAKVVKKILNWASNKKSFNTGFLESLLEQMEERDLTPAQESAVDNIIAKWKIPNWALT